MTLFDHFGHDVDDAGVVYFNAFIHLNLFDGSHEHADGREFVRFFGAHGVFHVLADAIFGLHDVFLGLAQRKNTAASCGVFKYVS